MGRAGERDEAHAPVVDETRRQVVRGVDEQLEDARIAVPLEHAVADALHRDRAQRSLERRLPHRDVAADRREERVPRPHRDREVEGADHADHAERVPLLEHPMTRSLRVHRQAVQHARLADREVGDVDHLLHFAVALGLDLAHLERHEAAEIRLVAPQFVADQAHGLAALRCRHRAPGQRDVVRSRHQLLVLRSGRRAHCSQHLAVRRIDRLDQRSVVVRQPAARRTPGARVDCPEAQALQHRVHARLPTARCAPVCPATTSRADTSLPPPFA